MLNIHSLATLAFNIKRAITLEKEGRYDADVAPTLRKIQVQYLTLHRMHMIFIYIYQQKKMISVLHFLSFLVDG